MASKIFISYRRDDDAAAVAARVADRLASRFGKSNIFIDVDNLFAGQRFDEELAKALATCDVLIAAIGSHWMDLLKAKITSGERDYVREEIAAALQRRIVVIPTMMGREGQMPALPRPGDLPEDIRDIMLYQWQNVSHESFGRDVTQLSGAITALSRLKRGTPFLRGRFAWIGATAATLLAGTFFAGHYWVSLPWQSAGLGASQATDQMPVNRGCTFSPDDAGAALTLYLYPNGVLSPRSLSANQTISDFISQNKIDMPITAFLRCEDQAMNRLVLARRLKLIP
jgi:hypothetical protein